MMTVAVWGWSETRIGVASELCDKSKFLVQRQTKICGGSGDKLWVRRPRGREELLIREPRYKKRREKKTGSAR